MAGAPLILTASLSMAQFMGPAVASPPIAAGASKAAGDVRDEQIKIAPGDVISIATYGAPELTTVSQTSSGSANASAGTAVLQGIKVDPGGEVELPYVGSLKVAGMSASQAARYLKSELQRRGIFVDPEVTIQIVDSPTRAITVLGEVLKPALVPAFGQMRLLDAISACGGFTALASHRITVRRTGNPQAIEVELGTDASVANDSDLRLLPGDTVIVPKVGSVFVVGYVKSPAAIPLANNAPVTVLRALALAGGVNYGAGLSKARIIRTDRDNQQTEIRLDLKKIMFGHQPDVALLSNDILFVPGNAFKAGMAGGGAGVAAALIYGASGTASAFK